MYNVIIVDDNRMELESVKNMIITLFPNLTISGCFRECSSALDFMRNNTVDIVVTDIQMSQISGLEMAEIMQREQIKSEVVLITCFDDSKYMRKAIELGVVAYVLKPVLEDEFRTAIDKAISNYEEKTKNKSIMDYVNKSISELRINFFKSLLAGEHLNEKDIANSELVLKIRLLGYEQAVIMIDQPPSYVEKVLKNIRAEDIDFYCVPSKKETALVCVYGKERDINGVVSAVTSEFEIFGCEAYFGVSNTVADVNELDSAFVEGEFALLMAKNVQMKIIYYKNVKFTQTGSADIGAMENELADVLMSGKCRRADVFIDRAFAENNLSDIEAVKMFVFGIINTVFRLFRDIGIPINAIVDADILFSKLHEFDTIIDVKNWIKNIITAAAEVIEQNASTEMVVANQVCSYISKNFSKRITLDEIAKEIGFSKRHIHRLFVKVKNVSILDYITEYRIAQAKKLLCMPDSKVYMVAKQTGYKSKAHFCDVFEAHVGMSPSEFKQMNK